MATLLSKYRDGGEGFIRWVEDNVCLPIYPPGSKISKWVPVKSLPDTPDPDTGRSYKSFWDRQKDVMREALRMERGRFVYRLIVLCWMRGEGKTYLNCLFQMWRFFCWPKQVIVLCANSREQTDFISFTTIKDIIVNSPNLRKIVGARNIQKQLIRLRDSKGNITSVIISVTSFSGIFSNITNYSFTEIHEMKNPEFFQQVHGSIRNIPNAMGFIDSTVSPKDHILYRQFEAFQEKKDPTIFFSYRHSRRAEYGDYWHPLNTQVQLDSYRTSFLPNAFDRYFKNLWTVGADKVFDPDMIEAIGYLGAGRSIGTHTRLTELLRERRTIIDNEEWAKRRQKDVKDRGKDLGAIAGELWPVEDEYMITDRFGGPFMASVDMLEHMGNVYDTDWAIISGIDRAQPMKTRTNARTIYVVMAKGLPGSRSDPNLGTTTVPNYVYLILHMTSVTDHSVEGLKTEILSTNEEYDGIDRISSETWGVFDMVGWCEEIGIILDMITTSYPKQLAAFTELYQVIGSGRLKSPRVGILGSREQDVLREELGMFDHDEDSKWFGSPEKRRKTGVQDDSVYAVGLCIYGGRFVTVDDFRARSGRPYFGTSSVGVGNVGKY
uniref:Terminase n=1 Tax=viral metagenome TaxID=1070528 RepID=A0A6M3IEU1_9ZZZZ